jgi:hypothetical protein
MPAFHGVTKFTKATKSSTHLFTTSNAERAEEFSQTLFTIDDIGRRRLTAAATSQFCDSHLFRDLRGLRGFVIGRRRELRSA